MKPSFEGNIAQLSFEGDIAQPSFEGRNEVKSSNFEFRQLIKRGEIKHISSNICWTTVKKGKRQITQIWRA